MKRLFLTLITPLFLSLAAEAQSDKLGIVGHNHLALQVKDVPKSAAFYREVLGLTPIPVPENLKAIRAWFNIGNGQQIHLLDGRKHEIVNDKNGSHFAVFVESIDKSEQYLKQKQIQYHRQVRFDGVAQIYFADPDGYLIELNEGKTNSNPIK